MSALQITKVVVLALFVIGLSLSAALAGADRNGLYAVPGSPEHAASARAAASLHLASGR